MHSSDSGMSDNDKSDNSQTESDSSVDAKHQRRQRRTKDVEKDARVPKKDSTRSTRALAGTDRPNQPAVARDGDASEDAHSGDASVPIPKRPTKTDTDGWKKVEHKRKSGDKGDKGKEPVHKFVKKVSRISREELSSALASVEAIMPQFDPKRHDSTTIFVGTYRGNEDDIRKMVHMLSLENMSCIVSFGQSGQAFVRWKTHQLARKFLATVVGSPETWQKLGGFIPNKTYVDWARVERPAHHVGARSSFGNQAPRPFNLRHLVPSPVPDSRYYGQDCDRNGNRNQGRRWEYHDSLRAPRDPPGLDPPRVQLTRTSLPKGGGQTCIA